MRGPWLALAVSVVAVSAFAAGTASTAQAVVPPTPIERARAGAMTTEEWTKLKAFATEGTLPGEMSALAEGEKAAQVTRLTKAAQAARFLPYLVDACAVGCRFTLAGTAAFVGWEIYQHYGSSNRTLDLWLDSPTLGRNSLYNLAALPGPHADRAYWNKAEWHRVVGTGGDACPSALGATDCFRLELAPRWNSGFGSPSHINNCGGTCWHPAQDSGNPVTGSYPLTGDAFFGFADYDEVCVTGAPFCTTYQGSSPPYEVPVGFFNQLLYGVSQTVGQLIATNPAVHTVNLGTNNNGKNMYGQYMTIGEFNNLVHLLPAPSGSPSPELTTDFTVPSTAGNTTDKANAIATFTSPCDEAFYNWFQEPDNFSFPAGDCLGGIDGDTLGAAPPATLRVLKPLLSETYADYVLRLQEQGWLGDATGVELTPETGDPLQGPDTAIRVKVGTNIYYRTSWPSPSPMLGSGTDITVYYNPPDYAPVDEGSDPGGGGGPGSTSCDYTTIGSVDVSPITGLDYGGKFPFGVFSWALGLVGIFDVTPDAPNWVITSFGPDSWSADWNLDLDPFSPYMATMRTVLAWVMWVGAIWYLATTFLGFRATGNPGDAVDGYLDELI